MPAIARKGIKMRLIEKGKDYLKISIKDLAKGLNEYYGDTAFSSNAAKKELAVLLLKSIKYKDPKYLAEIDKLHDKYLDYQEDEVEQYVEDDQPGIDYIKVAVNPDNVDSFKHIDKKQLDNIMSGIDIREVAKEIIKHISLEHELETTKETNKKQLHDLISGIDPRKIAKKMTNHISLKHEPEMTYEEQYQDVKAQISYDERLYTIADLFEFAEKHLIKADPDMNTEHVITDDSYSSQVIESVLMGYPLPALYFLEKQNGSFLIIDGIVRLYAIIKFIRNDFKLVNLQYLSKMNGMQFKDLAPEIQDEFKSRPIKVMVFTQLDKDKTMDLRDRLQ